MQWITGGITIFKDNIISISTRIFKNRQTIRSVIALLSSNLASSILATIGGVLVSRFLGPEETGEFRAYTIPLTYLLFLHLGTNDGLWRQLPYYIGKEMPERVDALASAAGAFMLFLSAAVSFGFLCCATYSLLHQDLHGFFGWLSQAFICWEAFYGSFLTSTYRTLHHFVTQAKIQSVTIIMTFGMVFLLPFFRFYGLCVRLVIPSLFTLWLYHRNRPLKIIYSFDTKTLSEVIKIGFPYCFWGTIYTSAWFATESALILSLSGASGLGLFSVGHVMRSAMDSLPAVIDHVLLPRIVTTFAREGSVQNANARTMLVTVGVTGIMIILACAGSFLLNVFVPYYIPKYVAGIPVMKVCLWFPVVNAAFIPMNTLFATGKPWLYNRSVIAGVVVFPLATYLLLPELGGLLAVAVGSLLGRTARICAAYVDLSLLTRREMRKITN